MTSNTVEALKMPITNLEETSAAGMSRVTGGAALMNQATPVGRAGASARPGLHTSKKILFYAWLSALMVILVLAFA